MLLNAAGWISGLFLGVSPWTTSMFSKTEGRGRQAARAASRPAAVLPACPTASGRAPPLRPSSPPP